MSIRVCVNAQNAPLAFLSLKFFAQLSPASTEVSQKLMNHRNNYPMFLFVFYLNILPTDKYIHVQTRTHACTCTAAAYTEAPWNGFAVFVICTHLMSKTNFRFEL